MDNDDFNSIHKIHCITLGYLVNINQDLIRYVQHYFDCNPAPFEDVNENLYIQNKKRKLNLVNITDYDIVLASYNILKSAVNHFRIKWNWSNFEVYLANEDDKVKWIAIKCITIVRGFSESWKLSLAKSLIKEYNLLLREDKKLIVNVEIREISQLVKDISKIVPNVTVIGGFILPVKKVVNGGDIKDLVQVPSTNVNLRKLAIAITSKKCICLQGVVGSGKTALVEYLAKATGHDSSNFIKVQLGDQTDSKILLGMYRCTDVPGEFIWQPGVITESVMAGKWLLLEDIDSAASDVTSVLSNLIETGTLTVPGYRDVIYPKTGFQLFVTQRLISSTNSFHKQTTASSSLQKHWLCVNVEPLSKTELVTVVQTRFPVLNTIAIKIVDIFLLFSRGDHDTENKTNIEPLLLKIGRQISTRDLMKWCSRAVVDYDVSSQETLMKIFRDALDIFCGSLSNTEQRSNFAVSVASILGIAPTEVERFYNEYKPFVSESQELFIVGRAKLNRVPEEFLTIESTKTNFSKMRSSLRLIESIGACVAHNEPVLLVGETGTGKTSSIQYIAKKTGHKLVVINMNQQSESTDLLGGYKPVDIKLLVTPIKEEFNILSRTCNNVESYKKRLQEIELYYKEQKWESLIRVMNQCTNDELRILNSKLNKTKSISFDSSSNNSERNKTTNEKATNSENNKLEKWKNIIEQLNQLRLNDCKPEDVKFLIDPIKNEFINLYHMYKIEPREKYRKLIENSYKEQKWKTVITAMNQGTKKALEILNSKLQDIELNSTYPISDNARKRKLAEEERSRQKNLYLKELMKWEMISKKLNKMLARVNAQCSLSFSFIEGSLINAIRKGYWVLLDEINLASAETLECLSGLLENSSGSLSLIERGDKEPIKRHENFRLFACMNPATDVGKKDLPVGLRNRFTEFYIDELIEEKDLEELIHSYVQGLNLSNKKEKAIVQFYKLVKTKAATSLYDGTGHKPHYSLRTLCRALNMASMNPCGGKLKSLFEAFSVSFLTQLEDKSYSIVQRLIIENILNAETFKAIINAPIPKPKSNSVEDYINLEGYWIIKGSLKPTLPDNYILTSSVTRNLKDLVRVVSIGKIPILLQGDTSVGKTSLIMYLAKISGHVCVRINNHEHTDLQEYIGSYVADEMGKLAFKEGILVEAMRKGYWIILDELNLAPSDVLEALNRVLDDNRELFIPETQDVVKAHKNFMLFATQNPPGVYGGRKVLSRAFRNRFVELHFDEIPGNELQTILHKRCEMPESYCKQVINVMKDLQVRRKITAAFAGKQGFITLRDLFRWGERYRLAPKRKELYDWNQHLVDEGYLVLAAKVRKPEEAEEIRTILKKHLKRDADPNKLFTLNNETSSVTKPILEKILNYNHPKFNHIVWTFQMRRMAVLIYKSCQFKEPILLVGETGGGKTTSCQLITAINNQNMFSVNCHMHTESADFLGNLRPIRERNSENSNKLFEWVDGPLINAMKNGDLFLADEISLADDSVLERLNSLLEPERSLLLAERGIEPTADSGNGTIVAHENFVFIGTMNPGGDFGKKELSPALRNRFTEVWCESCVETEDLRKVIEHNLHPSLHNSKTSIATAILKFIDWLKLSDIGKKLAFCIRDLLTWVEFINICTCNKNMTQLTMGDYYYHGACLTYIDGLGSGLTGSENLQKLQEFRSLAVKFIESEIKNTLESQLSVEQSMEEEARFCKNNNSFGITPFYIPRGTANVSLDMKSFNFTTPTTKSNTLKILRALQLKKPILLEGSPGVGKTSLVSALAEASGYKLLRINLSEQTDISDLFGADLPVEGGKSGEFAWRDGPFLRALRAGDWILLDELNLASQSVLEGLNACFDHRGEVYIPELGKTFYIQLGTKLFACQNPLAQGGGRRGLPKSLLNRFTHVFVDILDEQDLRCIVKHQFSEYKEDGDLMISFNSKLNTEAGVNWGYLGSPWEMNLRDITRWCELSIKCDTELENKINHYGRSVELIYAERMRTVDDKQKVRQLYNDTMNTEKCPLSPTEPFIFINSGNLHLGEVISPRTNTCIYNNDNLLILRSQIPILRYLAICVNMNWMSILVGGSGSGKSTIVRILANLMGQKLKCIAVNHSMDTTEILGGFEQTDYNRHLEQLLENTEILLNDKMKTILNVDDLPIMKKFHAFLDNVKQLFNEEGKVGSTMSEDIEHFQLKIKKLSTLVIEMKTLIPTQEMELRTIEEKLMRLSNIVKAEKCLNAGGKFEWVDSVLVKCLRDGTWLLIDQVNLCSSAVLDRLNGLLEPNGVLTIGERGVNDDGEIVTIKPHKNFRLFLTMDPRYGEISRAMRNRGIEIYMLGPKEKVPQHIFDLRSLLHNAGIVSRNHQDILLEIHRTFGDVFTGNPVTNVELKQAAFLIRQQITNGLPASLAIKNACIDVYIVGNFIKDEPTKNKLLTVIDEAIERFLSRDERLSVDLDAATLTIRNIHDDSMLSVIKQHGLVLKTAIEIIKSCSPYEIPKSSILNDLMDFTTEGTVIDNYNLIAVVPYLMLNFYEYSSKNDADFRKEWLLELFSGCEHLKPLIERSSEMAGEIQKFEFFSTRNDSLWDVQRLLGPKAHLKSEIRNDVNKMALILSFMMDATRDNLLHDRGTIGKAKHLTVLDYSNAVHNGRIISQFTNQPLITKFVLFVHKLRKFVDIFLHGVVSQNERNYVQHRKSLKWCDRFYELGHKVLIKRSEKFIDTFIDLEEISLLLRIHYKWILKFLLNLPLPDDGSETVNEFIRDLNSLLYELNNELTSQHNLFRKLNNKMKKYFILPLPHSTEVSMIANTKLRDISSLFQTWGKNSLNDSFIMAIQQPKALIIREQIIKLWNQYYTSCIPEENVLEIANGIEQFCNNDWLKMLKSTEPSTKSQNDELQLKTKMTEIAAKVQMWPFYEYMFLLYSYELQNELRSGSNSVRYISEFEKIPTIPANLIALLKTMSTSNNPPLVESLATELFVNFMQFVRNSHIDKDSKELLSFRGVFKTDLESVSISKSILQDSNYNCRQSILMNLVLDFILNKSDSKGESVLISATLGAYQSRVKNLKFLNDTLWKNSAAFTSERYNMSFNDLSTLKSYLETYLFAVEKTETEIDIQKMIHDSVKLQNKYTVEDFEKLYNKKYREPIKELKKIKVSLNEVSTDNYAALDRGKAWILLGYVRLFLFSNIGFIDPIHKTQLKLAYVNEDIDDWQKMLYVNALQNHLLGISQSDDNLHPRIYWIEKDLQNLLLRKEQLEKLKAHRPSVTNFTAFSRDVTNFMTSQASYEKVERQIKNLTTICEQSENIRVVDEVIKEASTWRNSITHFSTTIEKNYLAGYPDMVLPLLESLSQFCHGLDILINLAEQRGRLTSLNLSEDIVKSCIEDMIHYPSVGVHRDDHLTLVDACISNNVRCVIDRCLNSDESVLTKYQEFFNLTKVGLFELQNYLSVEGVLSKTVWYNLRNLLHQIMILWKKQQIEIERKKVEENSWFKNKAEIHGDSLTEEQEIEIEMRSIFPDHDQHDFNDIKGIGKPSMERNIFISSDKSHDNLITEDDIEVVRKIHSAIVTNFVTSKWWKKDNSSIAPNYLKPLIQRYSIMGSIDHLVPTLNENVTKNLYPCMNFMVAAALHSSQGTDFSQATSSLGPKIYDFYKDPNVEQVKPCIEILMDVSIKVDEFLAEYEDYPTCLSIRVIIERINNFPIISPVSRFLTGFLLLLEKMHEWQKNAPKSIGLSELIEQILQQVIIWKKLELTCWKDILNVTFEKLRSQSSKYWFHIYDVVDSYLMKFTQDEGSDAEEVITEKKLIETLEFFMNQSPLVEFESRLELLITFHCHVHYFEPSDEKEKLLSILWNFYNYYKQFVPDVNEKIKNLKSPIEKELKEFLKILKWYDKDYWMTKKNVHEAHKKLHKCIRNFSEGLKQSVASSLITKSEPVNLEDEKTIQDKNNRDNYFIVSNNIIEVTNLEGTTSEYVVNSEDWLNKMRGKCKKIISSSVYPQICDDMKSFIQDFVELSPCLREMMEIDRTLTKEKQISRAKSLLQQKKLILSNYFKSLGNLGVSYHKGVLKYKNNIDRIMDFTIPPLELLVTSSYYPTNQVDRQMQKQWVGCEKYYYKSMIKLNALYAKLISIKTDLGVHNIERCRGLSTQLMAMAHYQKKVMSTLMNDLLILRMQVSDLSKVENGNIFIPKQTDIQICAYDFQKLLVNVTMILEQINLYVQSCPEKSSISDSMNNDCQEMIVFDSVELPILKSKENVNKLIKYCLESLRVLTKSFNEAFVFLQLMSGEADENYKKIVIFTSEHVEFLKQGYSSMDDIKSKIQEIANAFRSNNSKHPIFDDLQSVQAQISNKSNIFSKLQIPTYQESSKNSEDVPDFEKQLHSLLHIILKVIEKKYKNIIVWNKNKDNDKSKSEEDDIIEDKQLSEKLIKSLGKDIRDLDLKLICQKMNTLYSMMYNFDFKNTNRYMRLLLRCRQLLEQYILLVQFYLNEQVTSFGITCKLLFLQLNVFLDLATNGFGVPKDINVEEGDEGTELNTNKGGMGLGDGEGTKDVSDRIESEDQLEDARPTGQEEEKPENKDCKEEEKGIDMSEDFDSKAQDLEKKEDDEEDSGDEEEDLDKQMGETGNEAEQLDEQIWGDDEESEKEEEMNEKEGNGKGEDIGENEMSAKNDDTQDKNNKNNKNEKQNEQEEENKINDITEPEPNDDQIDPYHDEVRPEPETSDLPEDINIDDKNITEDNENEEENQFDIDQMKEATPPPEEDEVSKETEDDESKVDRQDEVPSDEENIEMDVTEEKGENLEENNNPAEESDDQTGNPENKIENTGEDEEKDKNEEQVTPSFDDSSKEADNSKSVENKNNGSRDAIATEAPNESETNELNKNNEETNNDKGVGQAQTEQQESGQSDSFAQKQSASRPKTMQRPLKKRKHLEKSDEDRSLVDKVEPHTKKMKIHCQDQVKGDDNEETNEENENEIPETCAHVKNTDKYDNTAIDAATEEQVKKQNLNMNNDDNEEQDFSDMEMQIDEEEEQIDLNNAELHSENLPDEQKDPKSRNEQTHKTDNIENINVENTEVHVEGENVKSMKVERSKETTFHTNVSTFDNTVLSSAEAESQRLKIENMMSQWSHVPPSGEAVTVWNSLCAITEAAARDLSEKLRLVLEPTLASRLKGDYRTGKRINMRKIIPYIASQFRKDKIWLRRTKPSKRDYQIILALDDSSSMADNHSKELTFESLSLISKAMTYLEVGQLGVVSFGEEINVLHPLGESFNEQNGSSLIQEMKFSQKKTDIGALINTTVDLFESQCGSVDNAKLLVILSDGRGIFSEGADKLNAAIRRAKLTNIFIVFIIVDNPVNKDSIFDSRTTRFSKDGRFLGFDSYMERFPFPFYLVLRDINMLPGVLSDALRQWFEIVGLNET